MPLLETKGAGSAQGFGLTLQQAAPVYIESVFQTWLYTGNGSTQTITNGIDLSTKGGLVWCKHRTAGQSHGLFDTARGASNVIYSNLTNAQASESGVTAFNADGFALGSNSGYNQSSQTFVSWTFRKQPKFFDVVTWTGDGNASKTISHSHGFVPGCIITKSSSGVNNCQTYHRSLGNTQAVQLNLTNAASTNTGFWNNTSPTSTEFTVGTVENASGASYVAYLFAHNAGGFGLTGTDNVISCGSYTGNGSSTGPTITLGYEPQWVLIKNASYTSSYWMIYDNMRGWPVGSNPNLLYPNASDAEANASWAKVDLLPTGFQIKTTDSWLNQSGDTYIYIAIRRGPMKTPTTGTSVFNPTLQSASTTPQTKNYGITTDSVWGIARNGAGYDFSFWTRLQGANVFLRPQSTAAEFTSATDALIGFDAQTGVRLGADSGSWIQASVNWVHYPFRRAPGFFDAVCYTGTGANRTVAHNLGVAPELMIIKSRSSGGYGWPVYAAAPGPTQFAYLDDTGGFSANSTAWNDTAPTASVFTVGTGPLMNESSVTYVAYLFASCSGVSKVGSYTGTGALQTINCGFTGGARFVLIKRTDTTGDWYVWDSARGITSGNDPYSRLNSTAVEVTNTNYVDTTSVGFQVTGNGVVNASGGTYIFLAIA